MSLPWAPSWSASERYGFCRGESTRSSAAPSSSAERGSPSTLRTAWAMAASPRALQSTSVLVGPEPGVELGPVRPGVRPAHAERPPGLAEGPASWVDSSGSGSSSSRKKSGSMVSTSRTIAAMTSRASVGTSYAAASRW